MLLQRALYRFSLNIYWVLAHIAALSNPKARKWVVGRRGLLKRMASELPRGEKRIWVHCASVGEFEQARPVIERIKVEYPNKKILLTFFSPSGYELRKDYEHADYIYYMPLDSPRNAKAFMDVVNPELALLVKYEFWYYYMAQIREQNITALLISAIFRPDQHFFRPAGNALFKEILHCYRHIFTQDEASIKLLHSINIENASVAGDTRFDRVLEISRQSQEFPLVETFKQDKKLLIMGSSWPADEEVLIPYLNEHRELKVIIAPHEISNARLTALELKLDRRTVRYSRASEKELTESDVLIIDSVGMLSSLYKYGDIAYIGGGFGSGIHNILEAAVYGLPVFFGPRHQKFREAQGLLLEGGGFTFKKTLGFEHRIRGLLSDPDHYRQASEASRNYVANNTGATAKVMDYLREHEW